jgi:hypothetical protein
MNNTRKVRIGCASGFWGDSAEGAPQLLRHGRIDYLVFDYLSEVTMSILARAREKDENQGYARDFVSPTMKSVLPELVKQRVKVVANAGGINPRACRDALAAVATSMGLSIKIAIVFGDDLMPGREELARRVTHGLDTDAPLPTNPWSINAYLGAEPIRAALAGGADVVITGRCVDSALVLGPLMHEFNWSPSDYDRLAAGSLAGHIVECGVQATGGNFTDWDSVEGWDDMGFPIVECAADGSFIVTKPPGTGGLVTPLTVGEQLVYEIGDPAQYALPDVICDFTQVHLTDLGDSRVQVTGVKGRPPTAEYKVSATYQDGFRSTAMFTMVGRDARQKILRVGENILARTRRMLRERGLADYQRTSLKVVGAEELYGPNARAGALESRELMLRLDVQHSQVEALKIFASEIAPAGLSMGPGRCSLVGGRPQVTPLVRLYSFMWPKELVRIRMEIDGQPALVTIAPGVRQEPVRKAVAVPADADVANDTPYRVVPLFELAVARSGDKGNNANIGIIARSPAMLPVIAAQLTPAAVKTYFAHLVLGEVERFDLPGIGAMNFVLHEALDGGGVASLRNDPLGKCFAQMLLDYPVKVPGSQPAVLK